jgi:cytochrome c553
MGKLLVAASVLAFAAAAATSARAADGPPPWAWGFVAPAADKAPADAPDAPAPPRDNKVLHTLPGSAFSFTSAQAGNPFAPGDWFPQDHPTMPEIVAHGRESVNPPINACSLCHYPNGKGRPENANITGLSYQYIMQQLMDFRHGARKTSDSRKTNTARMAGFAATMTDEEMRSAATYFASIPATPWVKVVESETVPKTKGRGGIWITLEGEDAGVEPLGQRIIETPVKAEDTEVWRNSRSGFIAYVPPGSIKKGEALVTTGNGKVTACTVCHGPDLRGLGPVPRLAGRSPSYIARQLYDMQHGNRAGLWTPLMAPVLAGLDQDDVLAASAYLASLQP